MDGSCLVVGTEPGVLQCGKLGSGVQVGARGLAGSSDPTSSRKRAAGTDCPCVPGTNDRRHGDHDSTVYHRKSNRRAARFLRKGSLWALQQQGHASAQMGVLVAPHPIMGPWIQGNHHKLDSVQRDGWIFLYHSIWGSEPQRRLGMQDPKLAELVEWGDRQLIPNWSQPDDAEKKRAAGTLLDLKNRVMMKVVVSDEPDLTLNKPNALIALAIHGSGVTFMLANRTDNPNDIVRKVGMCNVPPYILAQTVRSGTVCIGIPAEKTKTGTISLL